MARKVLLETGYTFTPSSRTIVFPRVIPRERLVLITNVTTNQVIYNFSDPNLRATSYSSTTSTAGVETTTIILNYNTASMSSSDKLQITIDEYDEKFSPSETYMDPVGKMRVSTPQALIDTDFEYGTQATKWETLTLLNNKPSAFYDPTQPIGVSTTAPAPGIITSITGTGSSRIVTVGLTTTSGITVGTPIFVQDTTDPIANGWQIVETVVNTGVSTNFTYVARANVTNGSINDATKTYIFPANFFTGAAIPVSSSAGAAFANAGTAVTCTTTNAHGLSIGDGIFIKDTTATTNPPNGAFFVRQVPTSNTFVFDVDVAPTGTITATGGNQNLYPRPYSTSIHRAFDGGVQFSAGTPYHGNQLIRQTRRYFRYQSGKGVQFSTGTILKPAFPIESITSSSNTVTVTTKVPHNLGVVQTGTNPTVIVSGATQAAFNGTWTVASVPTDLTFTYSTTNAGTQTATGYPITVTPGTWYGSRVRIGLFDEQNGFFFEYDGQNLFVVRRTSTDQLWGTVAVTNGSATVTGTNTKFGDQLKPGDYVTIRGMSYLVLSVNSDTQMFISPEYRGTTLSGASVSKRVQQRVTQSSWNIDRCDGTGPSGYNVDLTKMQMFYADYSWYGAGAIRFGFKNQRGEIIYCHRIANANYRTEAYMRSGNLPARYECNTIPPITYTTATLSNSATTVTVADTSEFPTAGILCIRAPGNTGANIEYVSYSGKPNATSFTGLTRALTNITGPGGLTGAGGTATAATFTYSATAHTSVELHSPTNSAPLGHWGSSVIMDGRFDDDKSFIFTAGMTSGLSVSASNTNALLSLRLSPSVDSSLTGALGAREVINRMQLTLRQLGAFSTGNFLISLILNGRVSAGTFEAAGGSSLSQVCRHTAGTTISGGESIFSFFVSGGVNSKELDLVRDLGNSILGGGTSNTAPTTVANIYPDGPDIVTVVAQNLGGTAATINARISWTEAQA